jgi:hypothetical protein
MAWDPNNDPRWEGLDSVSLPNRPAHPDPSRKYEHTPDPDNAPVHGIVGHVEAKHGYPGAVDEDGEAKTPGDEVREAILSGDAVHEVAVGTTPSSTGKAKVEAHVAPEVKVKEVKDR